MAGPSPRAAIAGARGAGPLSRTTTGPWIVVGAILGTVSVAGPAFCDDADPRPRMSEISPRRRGDGIPEGAALAEARAEFRRRKGRKSRTVPTAAAARAAAEEFMAASATEPSRALKWVFLDEARKMGIDAGSAALVGRAIRLASAEFAFDELAHEYRSLREIPLRALPPPRAEELARSAEAISTRAETDGRGPLAIDALALAVRGWQSAGRGDDARRAALRHDQLVERLRPGRATPPGGE